eukprot:Skav228392  [mRNA]  locus=scaffold1911:59477:61720:+ [translate_table: standard]
MTRLRQELGIANSTAAKESGALDASFAAKEVAQGCNHQELQQRVRELEKQLKNPQEGKAHQAALENKRHDEAIALEQEQKRILDTEKKLLDKLSKSQKANQSLDARVAPLKVAAHAMREQQQRMRSEVTEIGKTFNEEVQKLLQATAKMGDSRHDLFRKATADAADWVSQRQGVSWHLCEVEPSGGPTA